MTGGTGIAFSVDRKIDFSPWRNAFVAKTKTSKTTKKTATRRKATTTTKAKSPKSKPRTKTTKTSKPAAKKVVAKATTEEEEVVVDRRTVGPEERRSPERRTTTEPVAADRRHLERREKVARRRQIDPTTCERDYTDEEIEFMAALDEYKRKNGRMFPTCSEILEVIRDLGYVRPSQLSENANSFEGIAVAAGEQPSVAAPFAMQAEAPEATESTGV